MLMRIARFVAKTWCLLGILLLLITISPIPAGMAQQPVYNTAFLTDDQLQNYDSMNASQIRAFLASYNSYFKNPVPDVDGVQFDAAIVIEQAAIQYQINPQVILATLEKEGEGGGVTNPNRPENMAFLMGCDSASTARHQLACSAQYFRFYHNQLTNTGSTISGWRVGVPKITQDGVVVTPANKAVAGQFTYTPYAGAQWGGNQPLWGGVYRFYRSWNDFGFNDTGTCCGCLPVACCASAIQSCTGDIAAVSAGPFSQAAQNAAWYADGQAQNSTTASEPGNAIPVSTVVDVEPTATPPLTLPAQGAAPTPDALPPWPPAEVRSTSHQPLAWSSNPTIDVAWLPAVDDESGLDRYAIAWSHESAPAAETGKALMAARTETSSPPLETGRWYAHLWAIDEAGSASEPATIGPFWIDVRPPAWQDETIDDLGWSSDPAPPVLAWPPASDDGELAGYLVYWGDDEAGTSQIMQAETTYRPATTDLNRPAIHYLRAAAVDAAGNQSAWQTIAVWRYDPAPPTTSLIIGNGDSTAKKLPVLLHIQAGDEGSGVHEMRLSVDGNQWTSWQPYQSEQRWQLNQNQQIQSVYVQARDDAGNQSPVSHATVTIDLSVPLPGSTSFTLARSLLAMSGGKKASTHYTVQGTAGQPFATGESAAASFRLLSGFWGVRAAEICADFGGVAGLVDIIDIQLLVSHWNTSAGETGYDASFDLNHDDRVDILDIRLIANAWSSPC